jgi:UDP-N-acetylglucosamine 4,6-dehydratase
MNSLYGLYLRGKVVLVTGGTGSFGTTFAKTLLCEYEPAALRIYSRDELKQYNLQRALGGDERVRFLIGDIRDAERLRLAMQGVDVVIHAAALKQVPACEYNPFEAVKTNINGGPAHAGAIHRQGRQSGEPVRGHQARRREDHHPG